MAEYLSIGGGYQFAELRVGASLKNPQGREVYFQPGDDTQTIRENVEALQDVAPDKLDVIADMVLGGYFA